MFSDREDLRSAATFTKVFDRAPLFLAISSLETGAFIAVNDTFVNATGYSRDEVIGRTAGEIGLWADPLEKQAGLSQLRRHGVLDESEVHLRLASGEVRTFLLSAEITDLDGEACILNAAVDITERKRAESDRAFRASLLDNLHESVIATDADRRVTAWNLGAERLFGHSESEALGRPVGELVTSNFTDVQRQESAASLAETGFYRTEVEVTDASGEKRILDSVNVVVPVREGRSGYLSIARDVTERKRAEARLRFLSDASEILFASLDVEATLEQLAQLVVPEWADWCAVSLLEPDGSIRPAAVAHKDPEKVRWARKLRERFPVDPDSSLGTPQVIRSGESEIYTDISDEMLMAAARSEEELEVLRQVTYRSVMIVPLKSRGRTLGALTWVRAETAERYDAAALRFAEELASRAGTALDNARLFEEASAAQRELAALNSTLERRVVVRTRQVRELAGDLTLAEARERARLAQVLHDELQQQLYVVQFSLRDVRKTIADNAEAVAALEASSALLRDALLTSRTTTANLSPPVLRGEGLVEALRWLGSDMEGNYGLEVSLDASEQLTVPNEAVRVLLFNLVREVLFNVVKHAAISAATVVLTENDDDLVIRVHDAGKGFDPALLDDDREHGTGLGLSGVHKRLQLFGGGLAVESEPGKGTLVTITMPRASLTLD